jgi:hypothetical protein
MNRSAHLLVFSMIWVTFICQFSHAADPNIWPTEGGVIPTVANSSSCVTNPNLSVDANENTWAEFKCQSGISKADVYITYDLGSQRIFSDVTVTGCHYKLSPAALLAALGTRPCHYDPTPYYFDPNFSQPTKWCIKIEANDQPTGNYWSPIATYDSSLDFNQITLPNSGAGGDANNYGKGSEGRRVVFTPVTKRYFRLVNLSQFSLPVTKFGVAEVRVGRRVIAYASPGTSSASWSSDGNKPPLNSTGGWCGLNNVSDGNLASFCNETTSTGIIVLDCLVKPGQAINSLIITHRNVSSYYFPQNVEVWGSSTNKPTCFDLCLAQTSFFGPATRPSDAETISFSRPYSGRYLQFKSLKLLAGTTMNFGQIAQFDVNTTSGQVIPTIYSSGGGNGGMHYYGRCVDNSETSFGYDPNSRAWMILDFGTPINAGDLSVTARNTTNTQYARPPSNWKLFWKSDDNPTHGFSESNWTQLANFNDPTMASNNQGRRLVLNPPPTAKRYLAFEDNGATTDQICLAETRVGRPIIIMSGSVIDDNHPLNNATDGNSTTFVRDGNSTNSGAFVLDILHPANQGVSKIEVQNVTIHSEDANCFPKDVEIWISSTDDPTKFDTLIASTTLNNTQDGEVSTIDLGDTRENRYYKFHWTSTHNGRTGTKIAEFYADLAPLPTPVFTWNRDPNSQLMYARLSNLPGYNQAQYWIQKDTTSEGQSLLFLGSIDPNHASNSVFYMVDLETGNLQQVTRLYEADDGYVKGHYFFASVDSNTYNGLVKDVIDTNTTRNPGNYLTISRYDLDEPNSKTYFNRLDLVTYSGQMVSNGSKNYVNIGSWTVSEDGNTAMYIVSNGGTGADFYAEIHQLKLKKEKPVLPGDVVDTILWTTTDPNVREFQINPTDPNKYTYYVSEDFTCHLHSVCMGNVDSAEEKPGEHGFRGPLDVNSADPNAASWLLNNGCSSNWPRSYGHMCYSPDGYAWCEVLWYCGSEPNTYVRFTIHDSNARIDSYKKLYMDSTSSECTSHHPATRSSTWFASEGTRGKPLTSIGVPVLQMLNMDANVADPYNGITRYFLPYAWGWSSEPKTGSGDLKDLNAHMLETQDALFWHSRSDITNPPNLLNARNILMSTLPNKIKAAISSHMYGTSPGPWKHGNRVTVDPATGFWQCDYGSPTGFGDGKVDQTRLNFGNVPGATKYVYAMADINGDGVDDRIVMAYVSGTWRVLVNYSAYNGSFGNGAIDCNKTYDSSAFSGHSMSPYYPPMFGDLNGDGMADVTTITVDGSGNLHWHGYLTQNGAISNSLDANHYDSSLGVNSGINEVYYAYIADRNNDGYGDRVLCKNNGNGCWRWEFYDSNSASFGNNLSTNVTGGIFLTDIPLCTDVNGDGYADVLLGRSSSGNMVWYAKLRESSGVFDSNWTWGNSLCIFGKSTYQPLVGHLQRYRTRN